MRSLLRFILIYHVLVLFLLFEIFSITLLLTTNSYQEARYYEAAQKLNYKWSTRVAVLDDYLSLHKENRRLSEENNRLYNMLKSSFKIAYVDSTFRGDTINPRQYFYTSARVINNSVNKKFNYITLDKGKLHGIEPEMAVICNEGIVGFVKTVSDNFCVVLSVLNPRFGVNAKIKSSGYYGPLRWKGISAEKAILEDIPHHVTLVKGDTILTSGYGSIFPENCMIGVILGYKLKGGNYYEITVKLSTDFQRLNQVQIIKNEFKKETETLEESAINE
jgi:rod shape-determining protein MreC